MIIMFNPSTGGQVQGDEEKWRYEADPTINQILKAVDKGKFGQGVTGVHIRNLFTLRSPHPENLVQDFKDAIEAAIEEENKEKETVDEIYYPEFEHNSEESARKVLFPLLGYKDEGEVPEEWKQTAADCELVVVAWGDCGGRLFQKTKDEVNIKSL